MEFINKKCSFKEHDEVNAITYCSECNVYMCNKCDIFHSKLIQNHHSIRLDKNIEEIFTGLCKEKKHQLELEFFCKTHNELCCAACIAKIKKNEFVQHKDCDVCIIEDIKKEKEKAYQENIKSIKDLSDKLKNVNNDLIAIFEKINKNKEELKLYINNIFTKIRNKLNNREDELIIEVDNKFNEFYFKEEIIKETEKLPEKINLILEKSKKINQENNVKLNSLINYYLNLEDDIKFISNINEIIKKYRYSINTKIVFNQDKKSINNFIETIKNFGRIDIFYLLKSSIIDIDKQCSIINWIKEKINKNQIKSELIFKMSECGSNWEKFHEKCDNKGPTLVLIKTTKNKIFGGFTPLDWKKEKENSILDNSNQTFIFSLNLMKKYDIIKSNSIAIRYCNSYGPIFGDKDIALKEDMKNGITFANSNCNFLSNNNLELTGGKGISEDFETEEVEVFKIIY